MLEPALESWCPHLWEILDCSWLLFGIITHLQESNCSHSAIGLIKCTNSTLAWVLHPGYFWLPPTNEVWAKVMFLHVSVILFTGEVAVLSRMCYPRKGGAILSMGVLSLAAPPGWQTIAPPRMAEDGNTPYSQQVGSMHPTGILSCYCQQMKLQEGNVFTPVCQSFCSQGGVSQHTMGQS